MDLEEKEQNSLFSGNVAFSRPTIRLAEFKRIKNTFKKTSEINERYNLNLIRDPTDNENQISEDRKNKILSRISLLSRKGVRPFFSYRRSQIQYNFNFGMNDGKVFFLKNNITPFFEKGVYVLPKELKLNPKRYNSKESFLGLLQPIIKDAECIVNFESNRFQDDEEKVPLDEVMEEIMILLRHIDPGFCVKDENYSLLPEKKIKVPKKQNYKKRHKLKKKRLKKLERNRWRNESSYMYLEGRSY